MAKGQNMAILIIGQGNLEFHAFHDFQLHIHGLAVKLKNNNHLQENLRFARNSRIWVDLIRVLQWRRPKNSKSQPLHHNLENRHKNKNSTLIRMRALLYFILILAPQGGVKNKYEGWNIIIL